MTTWTEYVERVREALRGDVAALRATGWVPLAEVLEALRDEAEQQLARAHDLPERAYARGFTYSSHFLVHRFGAPDPPLATWALPEQPGPETTAVRDRDGDLWKREDDHGLTFWRHRWPSGSGGALFGWPYLVLHYGPLTDASAETQP